MKLKVSRFRTRAHPLPQPPQPAPAAPPTGRGATAPAAGKALFDNAEDGFGEESFATARGPSAPATAARNPTGAPVPGPADLDAIKREGLTGRQLRMARRMAQKHGLPATSDFDAVRLLRKAGINPFSQSAVIELVAGQDVAPSEGSRALAPLAPGQQRLPQVIAPIALPGAEQRAEDAHLAEVRRIQADIVARRRRKLMGLWSRLTAFVFLPTALAGYYYFAVATPMYRAHSEFVIQQAAQSAAISSLFTGTAFATSQDSIVVQGYLQSPEAMERLDRDLGFRAHFADPRVDAVQRLPADASNNRTYELYRDYVKISYDPTEGVIKMDVSAAEPAKAAAFSAALIGYAEEQVDQLTQRLRDDQMRSARASFDDAQLKLNEAQANLVGLQERFKTLSSEADAALINTQIGALQGQLTQEKLNLAQMRANAQPNLARMAPVEARIAVLQGQIDELRASLTEGSNGDASVATVQSQLLIAQAEVQTRQALLTQATSALETARIEANRQTRYLSVAVDPTAPDEAAYPKAFENTLVVLLIFAGIYLMVSMTLAILREQVSN